MKGERYCAEAIELSVAILGGGRKYLGFLGQKQYDSLIGREWRAGMASAQSLR